MKENCCVFVSVLVMDEYYETSYWPKEGDKTHLKSAGRLPGGSVANAASVCAGLGGRARFYDVIGENETSEFLIRDLNERGIDTENINVIPGIPTPRCMIIQSGVERTIFGLDFDKKTIPLNEAQDRMFRNAAYVYTMPASAYIIPDVYDYFKELRESGCRIVFDVEHRPEDEEKLYGCSSILFFNEFGFDSAKDGRSDGKFLRHLFDCGVEKVVITLSARGCRVVTGDKDFRADAYHIVPTDTNGAGDTFNAAFLFALMRGMDDEEAAELATAAAARCLTVKGARGGVTDIGTLRSFIAENASLHRSLAEMNPG